MSYYVSKTTKAPFDETLQKVQEELKKQGFGVLTEIDVKKAFKEKLNIDFKRYRILGACNPNLAYEALQKEDKIGVMLPCNVVVEENEDGTVEVSVVDPIASMMAIENADLSRIASSARDKLKAVIEGV